MYGRGNFPPQRGMGPETSVSTSHKLVPPPYQHVNTTQQSQMMEKGPPIYPSPLVGQAFPPTYANEHHVPALTTRILSSGQSYLNPQLLSPPPPPPPPPHTQVYSAPMAHPFSSPQQNSQWTHNVQHVPQPLPPTFGRPPSSRSGPEILLPPPPPRPQPPPLSQGQAMFRGFVPSPLPGPVQGFQHTSLTQPPYTHGNFGSVVHPTSQDPRGSSTGLLPPPLPPSPPPGPPPLPPASPPPPSPSSNTRSTGTHLPSPSLGHHVKSDASSNKHSIAELLDSNSIAGIPAPISDSSLDRGIDSLMYAGVSHSPADSNMDIEDEMTEIDENQKCSEFVEGVNDKPILISSECEVEKQLHEPHIFANNTAAPVESASRNIFCSETSEFAEHREDPKRSNASNAAAGVDYESVSTELVTGTSAFKLLQDYTSDDNSDSDHDPCIEDIAPPPVYPSGKSVSACLDSEKGSNFVTNGTKSSSESERGSGPSSEHVVSLTASIPSKSLDSSLELQGASREVDTTLTVKDKIPDENSHANQQNINSGISDKAFEQKSYGGSHVRPASDVGKTRKEDGKYKSTAQLKVDEFGRLVKKGGSDSDSDDLRHSRRHGKRGRIRSRSRSPNDRRSLQRRRQKRSRSRSWSPKKPRSRSRSPFRHRDQYGSDKTRRDKGPSPACFDYQRGKCYRGASCRYSHSDSTKGDLLRGYKNKHQTIQPSPKKTEKSVHKHDEDKSQEMQLCGDLSGSSLSALKDCNVDQKEVVSARNISDKDVEFLISSVAESVRFREDAAQVQETEHSREDLAESSIHNPADNICVQVGETTPQLVGSYVVDHVTGVDARKLPAGNTCRGTESSVGQNSQANVNQVLQNADYQPQHMDVPCARDPETFSASEANINPLSVPEPHPDTIFDRSYPATGSASKSYSSETFSTQHLRSGDPSPKNAYQPSQFLPPPPPISQAANTPPQMPRDCIMMPQSSRYQSLHTPSDSFTPHQIPFHNQLAGFSVSGNSSWNSLPPPPPLRRCYANDSTVHVSSSYGLPSSQFQENQLPLRNDYPPQVLVGPYSTEMHTNSQVGEFHRQTYPPTQQPNQPLSNVEDNKSTALPTVRTMTQQFGGPNALGEGGSTSLPGHGGPVSSAEGSMHHQPMPLSGGSPAGGMQSFGSNNLHSGEHLSSSSQRYSHLQQPLDALQHLTGESVSAAGKPGKTNSEISSYHSDYFRRNLPSHVPDFVGSRIPTYYNPYASTFEQPASFKDSSNVFSQAKGMPYSNNYGDPLSSGHVAADGRVVDNLDSKNVTCSTNSNQAVEKMLLNSTDDQYDPLFDSIEPCSNSFRTPNNSQKHEITADSDMNLRFSGSNKPLDFAENTKQREAEAVAVMSSLDNDEYGETAEAEVGAVENGSPSDPIDEANTAAGETEIDQVKTSGKSKKGKDSRSMKLFKVALAEFVKEVLKPSWRQGNMSKEAFKTIVKKTVDKVSGAMKSHQVPKSQTKIDHYIDSSQRKLTKLVMGYVDKYVKV